ncbi:dipeptidyl aminopeptidase/acylaminoacyl peptidase [Idiomarina sp. A28L]|uniref:S9 family peptidase n=1 Tax=Idiomarina sp. A28L TaxID=1036674 RepID=UPI000213887F|nr:S9 family peptidase [Idiomarina sp. A28L]EGN75731.1 dipeptidyl aminopeptidase/acylaminoacyl peptidase [Idiomarina sp. A28L]
MKVLSKLKPYRSQQLSAFTLLSVLCASASVSAYAEDEARPITAEDYYDVVSLSGTQINHSGDLIAFVKTTVGENKRSRDSNIWLSRNGNSPIQFTREKSDFSPVFSPDGQSMLFLSGRDNGTALYQISTSGGEAQELLRLEQGSISSVAIHPNGTELLLNLRIDPSVENPLEKADEANASPDVTVITNAVYKRQGGYLSADQSGLWRYNLESKSLTSITGNSEWHEGSASFSPNGDCITYASNRHPQANDGYFSSSIFVRCGENERELATPVGHASSPVWTGNHSIAYVYRADADAAPDLQHYDLTIDAYQMLAQSMDHGPSGLQYAANALWFTTDDRGSRTLQTVDLNQGGYRYVAGRGVSVSDVAISPAGSLAWVEHNEATLPRLVKAQSINDLEAKNTVVLSNFNDGLQAQLDLAEFEVFQTENERGDILDVFFLRPISVQQGQSYPLILNIKGGPGGMWGHQWFQEMQLMRARGYAVVFTNYRGSSGYGQDFADQVRLDYGGADYRDNIVALDATLARYSWLNEERLFITGGSHGGFLTNWATTQTDRFRAAVTQRSVSNWISEAGTQAFPPLSMIREFGGSIWENYDYYWDRSPLKYANKVVTPTLIIHSNGDHITPIGQGEEWFYALKANDVPVELVVFANEGHGLSRAGKPINLVERLNRIINWFDRYNE